MIFLNYRNMLGKNQWKGTLASINNVAFFISYTVFRVVLFGVLCYSHYATTLVYDFAGTSFAHKVIWWFNLIAFVAIYMLNMFWYQFIVKGLIALFRKDSLEERDEEYKKYST